MSTPLQRSRLSRTEKAWMKWAKRVWNIDVTPAVLRRMIEVATEEGIDAP